MTRLTPPKRDDERGFTLIELMIVVVLLSVITGALTATLVTALNGSQIDTQRVRESNDAQLIASYLARDAQSAGGSNPLTGSTDPSLGVSLTDAAGCTAGGTLVARFKWIDRSPTTGAHERVASYFYNSSAAELLRTTCADGTAGPTLTLGHRIGSIPAPPTAACHPTSACPGLPRSVDVMISETNSPTNAPTPYTYTLSASVRPDSQSAPTGSSAAVVPLLLLASGPSCPASGALSVSGQGGGNSTLRVYGAAMVSGYSPNCPSVSFQGSVDYIATGGTSVLAPGTCQGTTCSQFTTPIGDPFVGLPMPAGVCSGVNPAPNAQGHYGPGVYPQALSVPGHNVLDPGTYVFCNGLSVSGTLTGTDVLLYFAGGSLSVTGTIQVTAASSGPYAGVVVWQRAADTTTLAVCCSNTAVATFGGTIYAPTALVSLHNGTISAQAIVARAVAWEAGGNGGTSIGSPPPAITGPASLPSWTRDRSYPSTTVTASGGAGTYTWSASGLPGGMSINSATGVISGTPLTAGSFAVVVTVTDTINATATRSYTLTISAPPAITTASLPNGAQGVSYSTTIASTGGTAPLVWSASGLPAGLSINSATGMISGTPTTTGASSVVVTVTDAAGATATRTYSLVVNAVPLTVSSVVLGNANGQVAKGDSVTITFNKAVAVNSMCSAWSGNASDQALAANNDVVVTVNNNAGATGNDTLTVSSVSCAFHLGVLDLGSPNWVTSTRSYSGNGGNRSTINYTASTFTLLVTLGNGTAGTPGVTAQTVTYTPSTAVTDTFGNAISGTYSSTNQRF